MEAFRDGAWGQTTLAPPSPLWCSLGIGVSECEREPSVCTGVWDCVWVRLSQCATCADNWASVHARICVCVKVTAAENKCPCSPHPPGSPPTLLQPLPPFSAACLPAGPAPRSLLAWQVGISEVRRTWVGGTGGWGTAGYVMGSLGFFTGGKGMDHSLEKLCASVPIGWDLRCPSCPFCLSHLWRGLPTICLRTVAPGHSVGSPVAQ
jgi:hypothetical protein